jgi:hypothetical protein
MVAALILAALLVSGCGSDRHREDLALSPNGVLIADVWSESGGGAAGYSADFVQIRRRGERFSFRKDYVFEGMSADFVKAFWKSDTELEIVHPKMYESDLFRAEPRWSDVSITYREDPQLRERGWRENSYLFQTVSSRDERVDAIWSQHFQRGDEHWAEDCVRLYWLKDGGDWTTGRDCIFVGVSGDDLRMKWTGSRQLAISYPPNSTVTKADLKSNDVTITYAVDPKLQKY